MHHSPALVLAPALVIHLNFPPPWSLVSVQPENVVYAGPSTVSPKKVTLRSLRAKYAAKEPICMVTAYDYPSAVHVDQVGGTDV